MTAFTIRKRNRLGLKLAIAAGVGIGIFALITARGAEVKPEATIKQLDQDYFCAGRVFVGSAATFRLKDIAETSAITGAGGVAIQAGYHIVDNVAIVAEGATENTGHSVFDSAAAGLQLYIPIKDTGLAPYAKVLGGRQFEGEENWFIAGEAGLEVRGKVFGAFGGVRYQYDLEEQSDLMLCIGLIAHFGTK